MASPEEVAHLLPETLPEDFGEWDGQSAPAPVPGGSTGPQAVRVAGEGIRLQSVEGSRGAGVAPGVGRPRGVRSTWTGPEVPKVQEGPDALTEQVSRSVSYRLEPNRRSADPLRMAPAAHRGTGASLRERGDAEPVDGPPDPSAGPIQQRIESRSAPIELPASPSRSKVVTVDERQKAPAPAAAMTDAAIVEMFRDTPEASVEQSPGKKKQIVIAAVSACALLLLLLLIPLFHHGAKASAASANWQPPQPVSAAENISPTASTPKPAAGSPAAPANPVAKDTAHPAQADASSSADGQVTEQDADATPAQTDVQSAMMTEQLSAPSRISHATNPAPAGNAPPPVNLGAYGMAGNGGPNGSVFSASGQPVVKIALNKPIAIAAGVANGLLIHKTTPTYPSIAREARIGGTVVLQAIISKSGTVKSLQVVSGPEMLRQAATEAVQTWRYTPYRIENQPVEMETSISVVFALSE